MAVESFPTTFHGKQTTLSPAEIERELADMWKASQQDGESGRPAASRVVLGNVIWSGKAEELDEVQSLIERVVPKFPCRIFLLVYEPDRSHDKITSTVKAQCFLPSRNAAPVCGEVIEFRFGPNSARHLRGCVTPLLLPNLQTVLLESQLGGPEPEVEKLGRYADRTITRAGRTSSPAGVLRKIASGDHPTYDLAWFRMNPIREQLAAFFDDPDPGFDLFGIRSVSIGTIRQNERDRVPEVMASLFTGWLAASLDWTPKKPFSGGMRYESEAGDVDVCVHEACRLGAPVPNHLNRIEMVDGDGRRFNMLLQQEGHSMDLWCGPSEDVPRGRHLVLAELEDAEALGFALNTPISWRRFRTSAEKAAPLLESLEKEPLSS